MLTPRDAASLKVMLSVDNDARLPDGVSDLYDSYQQAYHRAGGGGDLPKEVLLVIAVTSGKIVRPEVPKSIWDDISEGVKVQILDLNKKPRYWGTYRGRTSDGEVIVWLLGDVQRRQLFQESVVRLAPPDAVLEESIGEVVVDATDDITVTDEPKDEPETHVTDEADEVSSTFEQFRKPAPHVMTCDKGTPIYVMTDDGPVDGVLLEVGSIENERPGQVRWRADSVTKGPGKWIKFDGDNVVVQRQLETVDG